jgi:hypothetical protein
MHAREFIRTQTHFVDVTPKSNMTNRRSRDVCGNEVHPRTGHEGSEGEQMCSSTLSLTSALDGGGWSTPRPGRLTPRKNQVPIVLEAEWAPGPV